MASRSAILAIRIIADAAGAKTGLDDTATGVDKFQRGVNKASVVAGGALVALGAAAKGAAEDASALAESANAVQVTFGDAAGVIEEFGKTAAQTVGLSQAEFNSLATSTGAMLINMGYSQAEAADASVELTQRAADMASVFNTDVSTALDAINSGLRGESEPLRAFGVGLSDAAIKSKALEMGLYDGKGALDANAKAAATQALILEQSGKVAGDFANTSDEAANQQRILTAEFEDASAELGTALLPTISDLLGLLSDAVGWITKNQTAFKVFVVAAASVAATVLAVNAALTAYKAISTVVKVATVAFTYAQWALNVAMAANPVGLVVVAIVALVAGLVLAYKKSETFRNIVDSLARILKNALLGAFNAVSGAIEGFVGWLKDAWNWVTNLISKAGDLVSKLNPLKALGGLLGKVTGNAYTVAPTLAPTGPAATPTGPTGARYTTAPAPAYVTEEQVARAVARLLLRSDARNGRVAMLGAR